eukprot:TRINITY_DN3473_c0_g1_i1.p1 TRINITY_DN3473_c0_g1~~TRINITY_DN3473_c0_g1_i1.p1  ORF type:complete len:295 (-),score=101.02 TRINITY_DN3473_c0_g1_i1:436-1320(-)
MNRAILLLLAVLAFACVVQCRHISKSSDLPHISSGNKFEVFYLEAPKQMSNSTHYLTDFPHSAVGFKSGSEEHLFQYVIDDMATAFFPSSGKYGAMEWHNNGFVDYQSSLNAGFWTKKQHIGTVIGTNLNDFAAFAVTYAQKNPYYEIFTVAKSENVSQSKVFRPSTTCHDFSFAAMKFFGKINDDMDYCDIKRNYAILLSDNEPAIRPHETPLAYESIVHYFKGVKKFGEKWHLSSKPNYINAVKDMSRVEFGHSYYHLFTCADFECEEYFEVNNSSPYATLHAEVDPTLPHC